MTPMRTFIANSAKGFGTAALLLFAAALPAAPRKLAVVVGIDKYQNAGPFHELQGAANDARAFQDLLIRKFEFNSEDIEPLLNRDATHQRIIDAVKHLVDRTSAGDEVIFYYAGHGSRIKNPASKTGFDETIVPVDSRDPAGTVFDIVLGTELQQQLDLLKLKTNRITVVLDSCYSGTGVRGGDEPTFSREIPPDARPQPTPPSPALNRPAQAPSRGLVLLAAARPDQEAQEYPTASGYRGAFTYFLIQELNAITPGQTWNDVMDRVKARVGAAEPNQMPQLETDQPQTLVFGGQGASTDASFLVSQTVTPNRLKVFAIDGGGIQGLTPGSTFEVYPPGTRNFDKGRGVPATLDQVFPNLSYLKLAEGAKLEPGSRAVERNRMYADYSLTIDWGSPNRAKAIDAVRANLKSNALYKPVTSGAQLKIRLKDGRIVTYRADGSPYGKPLDSKSPATPKSLSERIANLAKWIRELEIDNPSTKQMVTVRVLSDAANSAPQSAIQEGDRIKILVKHNFPRSMFVALLDFKEETGEIATLELAKRGSNSDIPPGTEVSFPETEFLEATLPAGKQATRDFLKVFVTDAPVNFAALARSDTRGANPLQDLLANGQGTRGQGTRVDSWGTALLDLTVRKK